jgi:uncharacterized protein
MNKYLSKLQEKSNQAMYLEQGISYLGLFGSAARGEEKFSSDIDVLIDFNQHKTLFDLADIQFYLEITLGRKVDLVTRKNIKPILKPYIDQDLITIYEQN